MAKTIYLFITTKQRPQELASCLESLKSQVMGAGHYEFKCFLLADEIEQATYEVYKDHLDWVSLISLTGTNGLPLLYNMMLDILVTYKARHEQRIDYVCYFQDDVVISASDRYFDIAVNALDNSGEDVDFFTGFYTPLHPGFDKKLIGKDEFILSDSIDGKNFFCAYDTLTRIGYLPDRFDNGLKRGNPGPVKGSGFDLYLWKDALNSSSNVKKVNLCKKDLVKTIGAKNSTWGNKGDLFINKFKRIVKRKVHTKHQPLL